MPIVPKWRKKNFEMTAKPRELGLANTPNSEDNHHTKQVLRFAEAVTRGTNISFLWLRVSLMCALSTLEWVC
jgi:hypothetical protein